MTADRPQNTNLSGAGNRWHELTTMPYLLLIVVCCLANVLPAQTTADEFTLESEEDGIQVWVREETGGDMSVRVSTSARVSVAEVQVVLDDAEAYPEWVHRCSDARRLPGGSDDNYVYFSSIDLPFPFRDKEVVARIRQWIDTSGTLHRTITAEPDALPANDGRERMTVYSGEWLVRPADGSVTLQCTVRTDAGSGLPGWLRREILTGGPARTMDNLRQRLEAAR